MNSDRISSVNPSTGGKTDRTGFMQGTDDGDRMRKEYMSASI